MSEVLKDSFMIYHSLDKKKLVSKIRKLEKRITEIEKKQAERYPNLIGRIGRMENSFPTLVERLDKLEKEIADLKKNEYFRSGTAVPITKDDAEGGSW